MSRPRQLDGVIAERRCLAQTDTKPLFLRISTIHYSQLCNIAGGKSLAAAVELLISRELQRRKENAKA